MTLYLVVIILCILILFALLINVLLNNKILKNKINELEFENNNYENIIDKSSEQKALINIKVLEVSNNTLHILKKIAKNYEVSQTDKKQLMNLIMLVTAVYMDTSLYDFTKLNFLTIPKNTKLKTKEVCHKLTDLIKYSVIFKLEPSDITNAQFQEQFNEDMIDLMVGINYLIQK